MKAFLILILALDVAFGKSCYINGTTQLSMNGHIMKHTKAEGVTTFFTTNIITRCENLVYVNQKINLNRVILLDLYQELSTKDISSMVGEPETFKKYKIYSDGIKIIKKRKSNLLDYVFSITIDDLPKE